MPGVKSLQTLEEREHFAEIMSDPDRLGLSVDKIAEMFSMSVSTIYNRLRDQEISKMVKNKRAERIKIELPEIDRALIQKAKSGDIRAIELVFQRWDGYIPKHGEVSLFDQDVRINILQADGRS